jgi:curved DNA-binding protein
MRPNMRQETRQAAKEIYSICWHDQNGITRSAQAHGVNLSPSEVSISCPAALPEGASVYLQAENGSPARYGTVLHCSSEGPDYAIRVEIREEARGGVSFRPEDGTDYYEFLQISPKAEHATIQRVYRFLAARYHPDNPETGDAEKFLLLKQAYEVLSDTERRAAYDCSRPAHEPQPNPTLESIDYMDGIEGEMNRRMAVLSLLYAKRRTNPEDPKVSLADVESRMGFPREYLDFATWYLKSKKYITKEDNSDFELTALGVDFVESNASSIPILHKMLSSSPWGQPKSESAARGNGAFSSDERYVLGRGEATRKPRRLIEDTPGVEH